jgi:hypothetical protein
MSAQKIAFLGFVLACSLPTALPAAPDTPPSVVPPIHAEMTGWKIEKGNTRVLEESQKGPGGGRVLRIEGEASIMSPILGHVPGQETSYSLSYSFRRLSPGEGWFGCIQILGFADRVLVQPLPYQKRYPATSEEWTRVTDTFKLPASIDSTSFQIMTKPDTLVEVADLICIPAPTSPPADDFR